MPISTIIWHKNTGIGLMQNLHGEVTPCQAGKQTFTGKISTTPDILNSCFLKITISLKG